MSETTRIFSLDGVRYQVADVARAAAFYTDRLGFKLEHQQLPALRACHSETSGETNVVITISAQSKVHALILHQALIAVC